ncbi:hypothetical protein ACU8NH_09295 [Rhizobium leguminosarum]
MLDPRYLRFVFPGILIAIAIALTARGIGYAYLLSSPFYYWDHIGYFDAFRNWRANGWDFWSFFHMTHNEHRLGLTKLTMLVDIEAFGGRNVFLQTMTVATLFASGFLLLKAGTARLSAPLSISMSLLAGASMIGVVSVGNTAWPTQVQFGYAHLVPLVMFLVGFRANNYGSRALVILLAIAASEAMASGILAPIAGAIVAAVYMRDRERALLFSIAGLASVGYYLIPTAHDFPAPPKHGFGVDNLVYFFAAAGNWAQQAGVEWAIRVGVIVAAASAILGLLSVVVDRKREPSKAAVLSASVYAGMSIAAMAINRGTDGQPEWALTSRYSTPAIFLALGVAALLMLNFTGHRWVRLATTLYGTGVLITVALFSTASDRAIAEMSDIQTSISRASAMALSGQFDADVYRKIYPSAPTVQKIVEFMRDREIGIFSAGRGKQ